MTFNLANLAGKQSIGHGNYQPDFAFEKDLERSQKYRAEASAPHPDVLRLGLPTVSARDLRHNSKLPIKLLAVEDEDEPDADSDNDGDEAADGVAGDVEDDDVEPVALKRIPPKRATKRSKFPKIPRGATVKRRWDKDISDKKDDAAIMLASSSSQLPAKKSAKSAKVATTRPPKFHSKKAF